MLNFKVIGAGAAGNKASISLIEKGFNPNNIILINSTSKDIPEKYRDNAIIFGSDSKYLGGCGKERDMGKKLILDDLKNAKISLDGVAEPDTNAIIIVSSTEGGSGSAATPIIAKYIKEVLGIPVIVVLLFGFNTDVRGMQNSIEICQELQDNYGVIGISNAKFLDIANGNRLKAEQLANDQFANIVRTLSGVDIKPESQNIDDTDLFKIVTTPGYMVIEKANVAKIKNRDQYNKLISNTIDESTLIDCSDSGAKRIGIIYDIPNNLQFNLDFSADIITGTYGTPYEMYMHVQDTNKCNVTWICSGMPMPINEIKEIYENYKSGSGSVNKEKDSFFDNVIEMKGNQEDGMFNMLTSPNDKKMSKANFFADFGMNEKKDSEHITRKDPKTTKSEY